MRRIEELRTQGYCVFQNVVPVTLRQAAVEEINRNPSENFIWTGPLAKQFDTWIKGFMQTCAMGLERHAELLVFSRPVGDNMRWHDDSIGGSPHGRRVFSATYLTPTTEGRGPLRIIPQSFNGGYKPLQEYMERVRLTMSQLPPYQDYRGNAMEDFNDLWRDHPDQKELAVPEGSVVLVDERVLHGTSVNQGPGRRIMVLQWMWKSQAEYKHEKEFCCGYSR